MCGIVGEFDSLGREPLNEVEHSQLLMRLKHRGPDGHGAYHEEYLFLGQTRLSILDLSEGGRQPFVCPQTQVVVVFNGEIYNHRELRAGLESRGYRFESTTDGIILPALYREYGASFARLLKGIFAIAVYDQKHKSLVLSRDRFGIKPLYFSWKNGRLSFASEIKGISRHSKMDDQAIYDYLSLGYIPEPATGLKDIVALEPGHSLECRDGDLRFFESTYYRSPSFLAQDFTQENFDSLLANAVRSQLQADVPVGAFLSGGLDSSSVVCAASRELERLSTFCVRFQDQGYDESPYARMVAEACGTDHHEFTIQSGAAEVDTIHELLGHFDQPFGDSSLIPTYFISREIRKRVTVALSGDGGDEILGGYHSFDLHAILYSLRSLPRLVRKQLFSLFQVPWLARTNLGMRMGKALRWSLEEWSVFMTESQSWLNSHDKSKALKKDFLQGQDRDLMSLERLADNLLTVDFSKRDRSEIWELLTRWLLRYGLPGDMLKKVDMMSMKNGLEVRLPLLDEDLVDFCRALPWEQKRKGRLGKMPLRRYLSGKIPDAVVRKPKWGFAIPLDTYCSPAFLSYIEDQLLGSTILHPIFEKRTLETWVRAFGEKSRLGKTISRQSLYQRIFLCLSLARFLENQRSKVPNSVRMSKSDRSFEVGQSLSL